MGIIIANWSPLHGRGNTSNCIATAMQFSMKYSIDVFMTHSQNTRSTMEGAFLKGNEEEDLTKFNDLGIDSLDRAIKTGCLEVEDVKSYCNKITKNCHLISGTRKTNEEVFREMLSKDFGTILEFIKRGDNIIFIDIDSGYKSNIAKEIINIADFVIVTLDQTNLLVEEYINSKFCINPEKEIIVLGRYDNNSNYTKKYVSKKFRKEVYAVPWDAEYLDAINNHRAKSFFEKNANAENDLLFDELNELVEYLAFSIEQKGVNIEKKEEESRKKFAFFSA
ncbi:hypothetical protein [uncultured Clostridium sp.]|uniref:hypothetical protein n=1 Tax=uncultured Clostridium sp. TaxID=59620 RepID=UPI0028E68B7B|nr:hypothetical protein [uncultured Clostridium sp.]